MSPKSRFFGVGAPLGPGSPQGRRIQIFDGGYAQNFEKWGAMPPFENLIGDKKNSQRLRRRKNSPIHPKTNFLLHF